MLPEFLTHQRFADYVCWPVLPAGIAWGKELGQGADTCAVYGELTEMAHFLVKLTADDGDVWDSVREA